MKERYEIRGKINKSSLGAVYRGYDTRMKREVAIKRISLSNDDLSLQAESTRQTLKDIGELASLQHPHIVTVYDVDSDEDGPYLVMELISGKTLEELIECAPLTWSDFCELALQTQEILIAVQKLGLVFGNISPSNIKLTWISSDKFQVKIVDFGLAPLTHTQLKEELDAVSSTIYFMTPEHLEQAPLDSRTDIYAMGCVYYQALTGNYPFDGKTGAEVMNAHLNHTVTPIQESRADIPLWACDWIMWQINRQLKDRPGTSRECLDVFIQNEMVENPPMSLGSKTRPRTEIRVPGSAPQPSLPENLIAGIAEEASISEKQSLPIDSELISVNFSVSNPIKTSFAESGVQNQVKTQHLLGSTSIPAGDNLFSMMTAIIKLVRNLTSREFYTGLLDFSTWVEKVSNKKNIFRISKSIKKLKPEDVEIVKNEMTEAMKSIGYSSETISNARTIISEAVTNALEHGCIKNKHSALVRVEVVDSFISISVDNKQGKKIDFISLTLNSRKRLASGAHNLRGRGLDTIEALSDVVSNTNSGRGIKSIIYQDRPIIEPYDCHKFVILRMVSGFHNPALSKRIRSIVESYPDKAFIVDFHSYYKSPAIFSKSERTELYGIPRGFHENPSTAVIDHLVREHVALICESRNLVVLKPVLIRMNLPKEMVSSTWQEAVEKVSAEPFNKAHVNIVKNYMSHIQLS